MHEHHDLNNQIDKKTLAQHIHRDHDRSPKAVIVADFYSLNKYHRNTCHNGNAPDYMELRVDKSNQDVI